MAIIYGYVLIKTLVSKGLTWSSFSSQTIILHTIALVLSWIILRDGEVSGVFFCKPDSIDSGPSSFH